MSSLGKRKLEGQEPLSWRGNPPFSDWTIFVTGTCKSSFGGGGLVENTKEYGVHKNVLAIGPRRSEYFAGVLFGTHNQEHNDSTSRITLDAVAASFFPLMLDFMYSTPIEITHENAFGLKHLADYFGCDGLLQEIRTHLEQDFAMNAPTYLQKAAELGDKEIEDLAREYIVAHVNDVSEDAFIKYSVELFRSVIFAPEFCTPLVTDAVMLSLQQIYDSYLEANPNITGGLSFQRNGQLCNHYWGYLGRSRAPVTPKDSEIMSERSFNDFMNHVEKHWQDLDCSKYVEGDPRLACLSKCLLKAQVENAELKKRIEQLEDDAQNNASDSGANVAEVESQEGAQLAEGGAVASLAEAKGDGDNNIPLEASSEENDDARSWAGVAATNIEIEMQRKR